MYLNIQSDGTLSLEETDDFSTFEIHSAIDLASGQFNEDFAKISEPADNDRYWIDAEAILELSSHAGKLEWRRAYWVMLEQAERFGFADVNQKKIKAHVAK